MPGDKKKVNGYRVTWGGKTTAKKTTKKKAQRQLNLLRGLEHGWKPTGKKSVVAMRNAARARKRKHG